MSDDFAALETFGGAARLFPLPNVVQFPHVMLPLHIFEPRYRQMTTHALEGDRLLAMALLKPGWESDYEGKPALHSVVCLGKIIADQRLEDGRFNILLRGLSRARLVEEIEHDQLYRSAKLELLKDVDLLAPHQASDLRRELAGHVARWFEVMGVGTEQVQKLLQSDLPLGSLTDVLSFALPLSVPFKQELLEELTVEQRVRRLLRHLETAVPTTGHADSPDQAFPPEFSSN